MSAIISADAPTGWALGSTAPGLCLRDRQVERRGTWSAIAVTLVHALFTLNASSLWLDEAYSLGAVNRLGASLRGTHGTMGLYYVLLSAWGLISTATWWLRVPSVLFAVGSLLLLRPVARRIGGPRLVALGLPVAALCPMFAWKAIEARAYSLETLFVCGVFAVLVQVMDADGDSIAPRHYVAFVALSVAGVLSHGLFVLFLVPVGVVGLLGPHPARTARAVGLAMGAAGTIALAFHASGAGDIGTNVLGGAGVLLASTLDAFLSASTLIKLLLAQLVAFGLAISLRRGVTGPRVDRAVAVLPAAWVVLPCLTLGLMRFYDPVFNPRYLAPIGPGLGLVIAIPLLKFDAHLRSRGSAGGDRLQALGPAAMATLVLMTGALITAPRYIDDDWRGAAGVVAAESLPGDGIIFANLSMKETVQHRPPFEAAWREVPHEQTPTAVSPERPLGEVRRFDKPLSVDAMVSAATRHRRVWVVDKETDGTEHGRVITSDPAWSSEFVLDNRWVRAGGINLSLYRHRR